MKRRSLAFLVKIDASVAVGFLFKCDSVGIFKVVFQYDTLVHQPMPSHPIHHKTGISKTFSKAHAGLTFVSYYSLSLLFMVVPK